MVLEEYRQLIELPLHGLLLLENEEDNAIEVVEGPCRGLHVPPSRSTSRDGGGESHGEGRCEG